ncbi:unannotated protein [freshwater metagenome]|uniref:Unannotated protein n=1 Tax=freshwater metagenome TaxID=449393 RepID=A0A6J7CJC4_9ZZZZ|nr:KH domain-containing protein [Actinomycetota bacterium]
MTRELSEGAEIVGELLEHVLDALGLDGEIEVVEDEDTITGLVDGEDLGLLIGRHGQTIDAIQHLASRAVLQGTEDDRRRVVIDAAGYREHRREVLERLADDAVDEALERGVPVALEPMSASERRIVHEHLRDRAEIETHSEGEEPERRLVVSPAA